MELSRRSMTAAKSAAMVDGGHRPPLQEKSLRSAQDSGVGEAHLPVGAQSCCAQSRRAGIPQST